MKFYLPTFGVVRPFSFDIQGERDVLSGARGRTGIRRYQLY